MRKIKCLLVDDEIPAIQILEKYASMIEQLEVVASCHNALEAFDILKREKVDLLFLDINMPVITGIDFIKALKNPPTIIFTTAYREYAIESYEMDVLDYLLKPFGFNRFLKAVDKYRSKKETTSVNYRPLEEHIFFKVNRTNHKVMLHDILYLESLKDYTQIHTKTNKLTVRGNLSTCMQKLPKDRFVRIHRSFTVAIAQIDSYNQSEILVKGTTLPLGMAYREAFLLIISQ